MKNPIHPKEPEILRILKEIRTTEYATVDSIELLLQYGFRLAAYTSFSGEAMAEAKELLHDKRREAYEKLEDKFKNNRVKMGPMLMKDYVSDVASREDAYFILCERCNRSCTHTVELVRTAVSALKVDRQVSSYQGSNNY